MAPWLRSKARRLVVWLVVFAVVALLATACYNRASCAYYGYQTETETKYRPFIGCMVQISGHWVPLSQLRVVQ